MTKESEDKGNFFKKREQILQRLIEKAVDTDERHYRHTDNLIWVFGKRFLQEVDQFYMPLGVFEERELDQFYIFGLGKLEK